MPTTLAPPALADLPQVGDEIRTKSDFNSIYAVVTARERDQDGQLWISYRCVGARARPSMIGYIWTRFLWDPYSSIPQAGNAAASWEIHKRAEWRPKIAKDETSDPDARL